MVNDLKAFDSLSKEEIMKMTGQDDGSVINTGTLDRLIINRAAEDDDGNSTVKKQPKKPNLYENVGKWNEVVSALEDGTVSLDYVKSKFNISKVENKLKSIINK